VRNLPYSARICFRVVLQKRGQKEGVPIAGVSLPVLDYQRRLLAGELTAYLWPSEEIQKFRDSEIMEGEKDPQFMQLESRPVGENPEQNTGLLHLKFDSYELPVLAHRPCYNDYRDRLHRPPGSLLQSQSSFNERIPDASQLPPSLPPSSNEAAKLNQVENHWSPLRSLEPADRAMVFKCRDFVAER
jgi:hypothetical protein